MILMTGTLNKVPLILGHPHMYMYPNKFAVSCRQLFAVTINVPVPNLGKANTHEEGNQHREPKTPTVPFK